PREHAGALGPVRAQALEGCAERVGQRLFRRRRIAQARQQDLRVQGLRVGRVELTEGVAVAALDLAQATQLSFAVVVRAGVRQAHLVQRASRGRAYTADARKGPAGSSVDRYNGGNRHAKGDRAAAAGGGRVCKYRGDVAAPGGTGPVHGKSWSPLRGPLQA